MNFILPVWVITSALTVEQEGTSLCRRHLLPQTPVAWLYSTPHLCTRMPHVQSQYLFSLRPATHFGLRAGVGQAPVLFLHLICLKTWCKSLLTVGREGAGGCSLSELLASRDQSACPPPAAAAFCAQPPKAKNVKAKASPCSLGDLCSLCSCDISMVVPVKSQP